MNRLRPASILLPVLLLAGCSGGLLGPRGQFAVFTLPAPAPAASASAAALPVRLAVDLPVAHGLLDGTGIVVSPTPARLAVYAGARWDEPPPRLLRRRLLEVLQAGGLPGAIPGDSGALVDFTLESDLYAFQAQVREGRVRVEVVLQVRLLENASRRLLAQRRFAVHVPARDRRAPQLVDALGLASDMLARQVAAWAAAQLREAPAGTR